MNEAYLIGDDLLRRDCMDTARGAALFALAGPLWMAVRRVVATATATASHRPVDRGGGESEEAAAVLSYWFDGDTSQNYKYKWFPSSNRDIQEKADRDVTDRFSACLQLALNDGLGYWGDGARATIAKIIVLGRHTRITRADCQHLTIQSYKFRSVLETHLSSPAQRCAGEEGGGCEGSGAGGTARAAERLAGDRVYARVRVLADAVPTLEHSGKT